MEMVEGVVNAIPILIHRSAISMVVASQDSTQCILIHRSASYCINRKPSSSSRRGGQCYSHTDPSQCYLMETTTERVVNAIPILIHRSATSMVTDDNERRVVNAIPILIHRSAISMVTNERVVNAIPILINLNAISMVAHEKEEPNEASPSFCTKWKKRGLSSRNNIKPTRVPHKWSIASTRPRRTATTRSLNTEHLKNIKQYEREPKDETSSCSILGISCCSKRRIAERSACRPSRLACQETKRK